MQQVGCITAAPRPGRVAAVQMAVRDYGVRWNDIAFHQRGAELHQEGGSAAARQGMSL
jgi:hypothetical protein